jgi:nucleoside-diphosphate-sugar epimerase
MKTTVGIMGCGWLGLPLAQALIEKSFNVKGTTTSFEKLSVLTNIGIESYRLRLTDNGVEGYWDSFFSEVNHLIINIPPKLRSNPNEAYSTKLAALLELIAHNKSVKLIFVSSTSVYGEHQNHVTEQTLPEPDTPSGKEIIRAEQCIQSSGNPFTIVRFGGLIGPNRHPITTLSGQKNIARPLAPVNLIHLTDCIAILEECIHREAIQGALNAVYPLHLSRKTYYTNAANKSHLALPEFDETDNRQGKQIHSNFLMENWKYNFQIAP